MSELAFNINGEAFEIPPHATGWRVRRMRAKGSPEVVYGRDGLPLVLQIDAELDDLRAEVNIPGRYRLDLVDQNNKSIADVPSGYVQVHPEAAPPPSGGSTASSSVLASKPSDHIVIEAMRTQSAMALAVIERFPQMMEAAATLLRAADGAGLPAREPLVVEDDDDNAEALAPPPASSPGFEFLQQIVAQVVPVVISSVAKKKMPNIASVFDWRKATPMPAQSADETPALAAPEAATDADDAVPPLDPKMMGHFLAIQAALGPEQAALARELAAELTPGEVRAWLAELSALSVPDAVAKIRSILSGTAKKGGAS